MQSGSKVVVRVSDASWGPVMSSWSRVRHIPALLFDLIRSTDIVIVLLCVSSTLFRITYSYLFGFDV